MPGLNKITQLFRIKDLRNKIFFVLGVFAVFRLMANLPIPGIDATKVQEIIGGNQYLGFLNMLSGGALSNLSIVMLGLSPYITAMIILQILTLIFPKLEKLYKEEGEQGRQKFNQYCRIAAIPLAALQGYAMIILFKSQGWISELSLPVLLVSVLTITAGSMIMMWLGELLTEKGIGNGVSLLIFAGIVADLPGNILQMASSFDQTQVLYYVLFFFAAIFIISSVIFITEGRRNIPVSYAKRVRGSKMYGGVSTYLPLNINPAGVIPIIFALSLLMLPTMLAGLLKSAGGWVGTAAASATSFLENPWVYGISYFFLVFVFTFFYTAVTFDPKSISTNLQKMGGFIPGIRPGVSTANYLTHILNRVLVVGALFLGLIAIMPSIIQGVTNVKQFGFFIGGTAVLIIVSVVLETARQVKAQIEMRNYEKF
ncbi:MAG: preprotein translocase subunit SecY [Candidatus Paceibacterota bacterium]|jgi:preprotein translocase subunit SecY